MILNSVCHVGVQHLLRTSLSSTYLLEIDTKFSVIHVECITFLVNIYCL